MSVTFTQTQALLVEMANSLAIEATDANLTALSTRLTAVSSEINQSLNDEEFFGEYAGDSIGTQIGSVALVWTGALQAAASVISAKNSNTLAENSNTLAENSTTFIDELVSEEIKTLKTMFSEITANSTTFTNELVSEEIKTLKTMFSEITENSTTFTNEFAPDDSTTFKTIVSEIPQALENIQDHQQRIRELAEGTGIHMVGPYDWLSLVSSYIYYVNRGEILKTDENLSEEDIARAFNELKTYFDKIKTIPSTFSTI